MRAAFALAGHLAPPLAGAWAYRLFRKPPARKPPSARAKALLEEAEAFEAVAQGVAVRGYVWDAGGARPLVLLVHGWGGSAPDFVAFVPKLRAVGLAVAAFDAPGHGASGESILHMPMYAAAIRDYVRVLAERGQTVRGALGHSLGAMSVAYAVAGGVDLGARLSTLERLALISTPGDVDDVTRPFAEVVGMPERGRQAFHRRLERLGSGRIEDYQTARFLAQSEAEALVIHDRDDKEIAFTGGERAARESGAAFVATSGLGHRRILRAPEVADAARDFLAELIQ
jgi:pimeloyl-ACP methyl ester carboxylesterase